MTRCSPALYTAARLAAYLPIELVRSVKNVATKAQRPEVGDGGLSWPGEDLLHIRLH